MNNQYTIGHYRFDPYPKIEKDRWHNKTADEILKDVEEGIKMLKNRPFNSQKISLKEYKKLLDE